MKKSAFTLLAMTTVFSLTGCQTVSHTLAGTPVSTAKAHALLSNTSTQSPMGEIMLRPVAGGVQVYGKVIGLEPNSIHAIHIHEGSSCADMGKAAGGHLSSSGRYHGRSNDVNSHFGDMPNIQADSNGVATVNFVNSKLNLMPNAVGSAYNHTVVVHAGLDDYTSQPAGNAGGRASCGVITAL